MKEIVRTEKGNGTVKGEYEVLVEDLRKGPTRSGESRNRDVKIEFYTKCVLIHVGK